MRIIKLAINNFRNLKEVKLEPQETVNLLIGENAQGKTNFLEAIYYLAHLTGFRTSKDMEMLNEESNAFSLYSQYELRGTRHEILISYSRDQGKSVRIDGKTAKKGLDRPKVVLFTPDDLLLFTGSPARRRQLLDHLLSQLSREKQKTVSDFYRLLSHRNLQLRSPRASGDLLTVIDQTFAETAARLTVLRLGLTRALEEEANLFLQRMGEFSPIKIKYLLSYELPEGNFNSHTIARSILEALQKGREIELKRGYTLYGPHREDIRVYLKGKPVSVFASQGQQRTLVIATKIAEVYVLYKETGIRPILLLDEVFAELDHKRRSLLVGALQAEPFQFFATSVDDASFDAISGKIIMVREGRISEKE